MIETAIDPRQLSELQDAILGTTKTFPREFANAVNKTTSKTKTAVNREIRSELNIKSGDLNENFLEIPRRATASRLSSGVVLKHERRPGIGGEENRFSPRQTARGTSFKVSKRRPRRTVRGAFMGPRPGVPAPRLHGGVFAREGKGRLPITKLHGASAWATYLKRNMDPVIKKRASVELRTQIDSRINTILRQRGLAS